MSALLEVIDLSKDFTTRSGLFRKKIHQAVKPVSYTHLTLPTIYSV